MCMSDMTSSMDMAPNTASTIGRRPAAWSGDPILLAPAKGQEGRGKKMKGSWVFVATNGGATSETLLGQQAGARMAAPKRLPKSKEERDFDKLMRDRRPSVWEDKGSVGDEHFRSLKGAAKLQQGLLPPLAGAGKSEPAAADRAHGADGAAPDAMVAAQRAPRRHGCVPAPAPASNAAPAAAACVRGSRRRLARSQQLLPPPQLVVARTWEREACGRVVGGRGRDACCAAAEW